MPQNRTNNLKWKFPDFPPRPMKKEVVFSLMNYNDGLYFVNGSDEILDTVSSDSFGFILDSSLENNPRFFYENVKPGESVKVEEYDGFYDLDYFLGFEIYIKSNSFGKVKIIPPMRKGGVIAQPLMYKDKSTPRFVTLKNIKE